MAAASLHNPITRLSDMSGRRQPLADVPNKLNSPLRNYVVAGAKRTRAPDPVPSGQPPLKKQNLDIQGDDTENVDPKRRDSALGGLNELTARRAGTQSTSLERKLVAARERKPVVQQRLESAQKTNGDNLDSVRQWQRHYRKQFPSFVFYFDGVAEDVRTKVARQITSLGGREEKFFSKAVNHVITTRAIPPEGVVMNPQEDLLSTKQETVHNAITHTASAALDPKRTTQLLEANLQRRNQNVVNPGLKDIDSRRMLVQGADVLSRARDLGIKIWALEKLQRILKTILGDEASDQDILPARGNVVVQKPMVKQIKEASLEQLLRNEKINGPADRDMAVAAQNMTEFRGCYLYIHDMDEKTKPTLQRDYAKPERKDLGKWPQFRLTPVGRCPFVEDAAHTKKLQAEEQRVAEEAAAAQRRTRAASTINPALLSQHGVLTERQSNLRRSPRKLAQDVETEKAKPLDPPKLVPTKRQSSADADAIPSLFGSAQVYARGMPRMAGGQPIASGVQPSNVTSAIRSQVISSTAISSTAPMGRRVPDSKEVSALKRKVLERGTSALSNQSMPSSYMNDMRAALNNEREPPPRAAKRKAQETLGVVHEDEEAYVDEARLRAKSRSQKRSKKAEKEPKPGYCENCRDKFEDFDEHIQTRKHRKFALTDSNWKELDALLGLLKRPHRDC